MKNKFLLLLSFFLLTQNAESADNFVSPVEETTKNSEKTTTRRRLSIKAMSIGVNKALEAIKQDPFSEESVWDQNFLKREQEVSETLTKFIKNEYGQKAKNLKLEGKTKAELEKILLDEGFEKRKTDGRIDGLLGRSKDRDFQDSGDIYVHSDGSMIRIKDSSSYRKHRPQSYIIKAVLKNPSGPVTWQNEAFKISKEGYPLPKSPKQTHGLKIHAPNSSGIDEDKGWVDLIMEEVHIDFQSLTGMNKLSQIFIDDELILSHTYKVNPPYSYISSLV